MLCLQHFYNTFIINHKLQVVIGSNLNLRLKLLFCHLYQPITIYHLKFVVKVL